MPDIADAVIYYVVFLFSTTLHEAAHAWAAARGGDLTAYHGGQVSLSPIPHIKREPVGMVVLPLISVLTTGWPFGYASAPFDRDWASRYPKRAGWMALAGPAANLLLVIIAAILVRIGVAAHVFFPPETVRFGEIAGTVDGGMWPAAIRSHASEDALRPPGLSGHTKLYGAGYASRMVATTLSAMLSATSTSIAS